MQTLFKFIQSIFFLGLLIGNAPYAKAQTEVVVDRNGSAAPDGSTSQPYQLVKAGACRGKNGKVVIRPGVYPETLTIKDPMLLTATGPATIGALPGKPHTTLKIVSYNTHLYGDEAPTSSLRFADSMRADLIAQWLKIEDADVVGLQEVWDPRLAEILINRAGYPHSRYFNDRDEWDDRLNSGLLLLSRHPLMNPSLTFYRDEVNISDCPMFDFLCLLKNPTEPWKCFDPRECFPYLDGMASKGFLQATVNKNGFPFGIFVTHTQAEHHSKGVNARRKQLEQLGAQIQQYRFANPEAEVIAMGDFNVIAGSEDYLNSLLRHTGLRDTYPNLAPCPEIPADQATCDFHRNDLARYFDNTKFDCDNRRLDYLLYSHGSAYDVLPISLAVRRYLAEFTDKGKTLKDLSDHYAIAAEYALWRNQ